MMRAILFATVSLVAGISPSIGQEFLDGTWKLISSKRTTTATGASVDTFGSDPKGYITYGKDGRVMVLQTRGDRPRPENVEGITEEQKIKLFSSMLAYAGTYKFDGTTIEHHIDLSWNELWNGTTLIRNIKKEGDRLIYTTQPSPSPIDGSMGFAVLVWERIR